jgi:hypothetical protein
VGGGHHELGGGGGRGMIGRFHERTLTNYLHFVKKTP